MAHGKARLADGVYLGTDSLRYAMILSGSDTVRFPFDGGYSAQRFVRGASRGRVFRTGIVTGVGVGVILAGGTVALRSGPAPEVYNGIAALFATMSTVVGFMVGGVMAVAADDVWEDVRLSPGGRTITLDAADPRALDVPLSPAPER